MAHPGHSIPMSSTVKPSEGLVSSVTEWKRTLKVLVSSSSGWGCLTNRQPPELARWRS